MADSGIQVVAHLDLAILYPVQKHPADESLIEAMKIPRRLKMAMWMEDLRKHENHPTFYVADSPQTREKGFMCECSGTPEYFRIDIRTLKECLPEARETYARFQRYVQRQEAREKREARGADRRAKALLFRYLTREQKAQLRATRHFDVTGQDGHLYRVGGYGGVIRVENDVESMSFCIHSTEALPNYDVMLAQKVLLQRDIAKFMKTANARDLLAPLPPEEPRERDPIWDSVRPEDLDDVAGWVSRQLGETHEHHEGTVQGVDGDRAEAQDVAPTPPR